MRHNRIVAPASVPAEVEVEQPTGAEKPERDVPWIVIVWNDPINLMSYVTLVFQKLSSATAGRRRRG
jgi:ATP-dependent Clp protease adaptor protein ClpS